MVSVKVYININLLLNFYVNIFMLHINHKKRLYDSRKTLRVLTKTFFFPYECLLNDSMIVLTLYNFISYQIIYIIYFLHKLTQSRKKVTLLVSKLSHVVKYKNR